MAVGQRPDEPDDDRFNMAVMGLRLAGRSNGVAQLHGAVSREMFHGLWPDVPVDEVPIGAITNGVHAHTWVSDGIADLLASSVGPVWDGADEASWAGVGKLAPSDGVGNAGQRVAPTLVSFVRAKFGDALLDPNALTIGFARRFATYKRATLLLSQPERLRRLLLDADRPVQFVFAGKAHPADQPGKDMIREIEIFARQLDVGNRFVFLQDYDMAVARTMLHGCDVWLNNPRRPLEACGTSGMKAALNGALNCSILDGWWDECYDGHNGWAIASADDDADIERRDRREAHKPVRPARARDRPAVLRPRHRRRARRMDRQDEGQLVLTRPVRHRGAHGPRLHLGSCTNRPLPARQAMLDDHAARGRGSGSLEAACQPMRGPTSRSSISTSTPLPLTKATNGRCARPRRTRRPSTTAR